MITNEHTVKHGYHKRWDTPKDIRKRKKKAEAKQYTINQILKLAAEHGLSYGVAVARLEDGRL